MTQDLVARLAGVPPLIRKVMQPVREAGWTFWGAFVALPLVAVVVVVVLPSVRVLEQAAVRTEASMPLTASVSDDHPARDAAAVRLDSLQRRHAFLAARLDLAARNAIGLSVDLADRVVQVEIGGVPVRRCAIQRVQMGPASAQAMFPRVAPRLFTLERAIATIPHSPVRVVTAPKDSIEAAARPPLDVTTETHDTHVLLYFDQGLTLKIEQSPSSVAEGIRGTLFDAKARLHTAGDVVVSLLHGRLPEHELRIEVELSGDDARAVYRALPPDARLALRW